MAYQIVPFVMTLTDHYSHLSIAGLSKLTFNCCAAVNKILTDTACHAAPLQ